jgi:rod shape-determining protein MreD
MSASRSSSLAPVYFSILLGLMLSILPLPASLSSFRPDFVALTLIYWAMMLPRNFSIGKAWIIGVILDVMQGTLFGQHALALTVVIYLTIQFHLRIRVFPVWQVTAAVFALTAIYQFLLFWINGVVGQSALLIDYWGPVLANTILWPLLSGVLGGVRQRISLPR